MNIAIEETFDGWSMSDRTLQPDYLIPLYKEAFPNGMRHELEGVGHYCHEDAPEEIGKLIDSFIQTG